MNRQIASGSASYTVAVKTMKCRHPRERPTVCPMSLLDTREMTDGLIFVATRDARCDKANMAFTQNTGHAR